MKNGVFYSLIFFFSVLSNTCWSQVDSIRTEKVDGCFFYFGLGGGLNTRGGNGNLSLTMTTARGLGGSVNFMFGSVKLDNVPSDYYSLFRWLPPTDNFTILSFNLVKKFSNSSGSFRFGLETGPSWVRYNLTTIELNPGYPLLFQYKYNKIYTLKNTVGLSMAIKAELPFFRFSGLDLSFFANINSIRSIAGLDVCLELGKVRNK